ncbi:MAG: 50S ribosomal protein L25 [Lentisphaeraceae bacterium]|nr:50S ribosomal protein L25 [Lentisphaeraceae bacterium]
MAITIKGQERTVKGKKVKTLRRDGLVPAEVYGRAGDNISAQFCHKELQSVLREAGTTALINLDIDGKIVSALVKEVVRSLDRKSIMHIDLYSVDNKELLTTAVPVRVIGESPLVAKGGILVVGASSVEVTCLPTAIPSELVVDSSGIKDFSDVISVGDIETIDGIEIVSNKTSMVCYVSQTRATREAAAAEKGEVYVEQGEESAEAAAPESAE